MFNKRYVINQHLELKKIDNHQINELYDFLNSLNNEHHLGFSKSEVDLVNLEEYIVLAKKRWTEKSSYFFVIYLDKQIFGLIKINVDKTNGQIKYLLQTYDPKIIEQLIDFFIRVAQSTNLKWLYLKVEQDNNQLDQILNSVCMYKLNSLELKEINIVRSDTKLIDNYWAKRV
ncbi:hypothetical protein HFMG06CAA_3870 [Mycoplasmoides gallisepticum CA06_2006.052-5-2P]|uniref:N-acetyltransferase domain-containing protein n=1 Tax=Mycoplasmoides gallisepticum WI01_2001.043-13-2P TaxID=1159201 RepID=J3VHB6_MYCGL|nr:hypothetical protein [Mycoplasmoides gallisepticum]AFP76066.1 hypothetical protein HFMG94VAA_3821 [Mycoplasmoides gallisepticum VA94_7994-1-7P]AFP76833.1 hypothetical protein HFMG95NCA_3748 [Mycoplasmoides gallisepticum NC95_13295-2-2P]AFP77587.1 hypothetical protein HFMG96NCA_3918 [Mycoplasmoides gallisepticum NC96_1596-4-2P]AFP78358.1 hypothetical protein HFMG01NYA_3810 [Mycoplasmoides gallisepticum NY01_2001.047-5-1P]AFP79118.1 hypothetical protein HFMG01WIA_3670 [Mycoplasmoides gallisep